MLRAVILRVARRKLAAPIQRQTKFVKLCTHRVYVFVGPLTWMNSAFHSGVFGWHPERVPSHGVKNIVAFSALMAGDDVADRVIAHVTHMKPAARIWKHLQHVSFRRIRCFFRGSSLEDILLIPDGTPFGFRLLRIVTIGQFGPPNVRRLD